MPHLSKMLRNSILGNPKKTFQSIAFESKIKLSQGRSVKLKKIRLGSKIFPTHCQNVSNATAKFSNTSKNDNRHEKIYSTIKHLSVQ